MNLPEKVQAAVDVLARYELSTERVAPFFYRLVLRLRPETPPPLFGATPAYWRMLALAIAVLAAGMTTAFTGALLAIERLQGGTEVSGTVFLVGQFFVWAFWALVGWASAAESRRSCTQEATSIGLPAWHEFDRAWQPPAQTLQQRTDLQRYWLRALLASPLVPRAAVVGAGLFALLAATLPVKATSVAELLGLVYLIMTALYLKRTREGRPMPERATAYFLANGFWLGFVSAGTIWSGFVADVLQFPQSMGPMILLLLVAGLHIFERMLFDQHKALRTRVERIEQDKLLAEARLQALNAQIEPHFIFNTIAHLKSLIATEPAKAESVADELSAFLRASLLAMRSASTTVAQDMALVRNYLWLAALRMGERLQFDVRTGAGAGAHPVPPLLLLTLVENAVQHGIEPKLGAGQVRVTADVVQGAGTPRLLLRVVDDGVGFGQAHSGGTGVGLANVRERLRSLHGGAAALRLSANQPSGVIAEVELPLEAGT